MLDAMGEEEEASLVCEEIEGRRGMEWRMELRPMPKLVGTSRTWRMDYKVGIRIIECIFIVNEVHKAQG